MRHTLATASLLLAFSLPASAATLLCAPVGLSEVGGEIGPLVLPLADPGSTNPFIFWVDTDNGHVLEYFENGEQVITNEFTLEAMSEPFLYFGIDEDKGETYRIDMSVLPHPYQRSIDKALTQIGACVPAPMEEVPAEAAEWPVFPFPYAPSKMK